MMPSNGQLRTCQILVFIISGTAGLVVSISLAWTSSILDGKCVLYSDMQLRKHPNGTLSLLNEISDWGNPTECSFGTFSPVGVTIYCIIWIWFYIFLSDWGTSFIEDKPKIHDSMESPPTDQHLLIPSIVCNVLVFGLILATVAIIEAGRSEWCENLENAKNLDIKTCSYVGTVVWLNVQNGDDIYGYLSHARVSCWVLLVAMIVQSGIIFIRLRRNSRRSSRPDSSASEVSSGPFTEDYRAKIVDLSHVSEQLSDSDLSGEENSKRRQLKRQKKVVIDEGCHGTHPDDEPGPSTQFARDIGHKNVEYA